MSVYPLCVCVLVWSCVCVCVCAASRVLTMCMASWRWGSEDSWDSEWYRVIPFLRARRSPGLHCCAHNRHTHKHTNTGDMRLQCQMSDVHTLGISSQHNTGSNLLIDYLKLSNFSAVC